MARIIAPVRADVAPLDAVHRQFLRTLLAALQDDAGRTRPDLRPASSRAPRIAGPDEAAGRLVQAMTSLLTAKGYIVLERTQRTLNRATGTRACLGYCNHEKLEVVVVRGLPAAQRAVVLTHEFLHTWSETDRNALDETYGFDAARAVQECRIQAATCLIASRHGVDCASFSAFYIATWATMTRRGVDILAEQADWIVDTVGSLERLASSAPYLL